MHVFLEIKSPKNECRRFFSTFANFEKNKNRQTFRTCISKTTHPKVSFGKIKWNLIFWFCPAILDPYGHLLLRRVLCLSLKDKKIAPIGHLLVALMLSEYGLSHGFECNLA